MEKIPFTTLVGTGNDFVLIDTIRHRVKPPKGGWPALARTLCDERQTGTDGLLLLGKSRRADISMRIFNPDGSEASMCGNGVRCLAWYAHAHRLAKQGMAIETPAGLKAATIEGRNRVRIDMGVPRESDSFDFKGVGVPMGSLFDSGVPHLVCWVKDVRRINVERLGRKLRHDRQLQPQGANVDFVQMMGWRVRYDQKRFGLIYRMTLKMRTYERGVEGETQACGTGAVAVAAAAVLQVPVSGFIDDALFVGREGDMERFFVDVRVPGGVLQVQLGARYARDTRRVAFSRAFLEGDVRVLSSGAFQLNGRSGV
jgi:diaminopimelate epimerase